MKKVQEITKEQLTKIQEQQKQLSDLLKDIGFVEVQKHALLHKQAGLNDEIETYKAELEKEYGAITIDIETGSYTEIKKEE
jgi:ASC-1-like (ASCH) protein